MGPFIKYPTYNCQKWNRPQYPAISLQNRVGPISQQRTRLSTPNLCRKQLQGNATPANPHFLRVLTRFAHIVPPSSRSIFTEIQEKSP